MPPASFGAKMISGFVIFIILHASQGEIFSESGLQSRLRRRCNKNTMRRPFAGGAGEGEQRLAPDDDFESRQQVKSDNLLPNYCEVKSDSLILN